MLRQEPDRGYRDLLDDAQVHLGVMLLGLSSSDLSVWQEPDQGCQDLDRCRPVSCGHWGYLI